MIVTIAHRKLLGMHMTPPQDPAKQTAATKIALQLVDDASMKILDTC